MTTSDLKPALVDMLPMLPRGPCRISEVKKFFEVGRPALTAAHALDPRFPLRLRPREVFDAE